MQDIEKDKLRKVVINSVRKSIMAGGGIMNTMAQQSLIANMAQSSSLNNQPHNNQMHQNSNQIAKLNQQIIHLKEKNDQSLIKVRFLCDKLQSYGGLNSIPETVVNEISETDLKIKKLQELLYFKKSKQMKKLRKKIQRFVELIQFQITEQDLNKIEDQIEIIFFLIDIFSEKYNHIMGQKAEIDQIVQGLRQDTVFNREHLEQQNKLLKQKNAEQLHYIRDLQIQLVNIKKDTNNFLRNPSSMQMLSRNQSSVNNQNNKILQQTIKVLQADIENYISKIYKLESNMKNSQYQIINYKRKIEDFQTTLKNQKNKYRQLQQEYIKVQRQEARWKQRYELMQRQKNQRIQLLQKQKRLTENLNYNRNKFPNDQFQQIPNETRRVPKVNINKMNKLNDKYQNDIIQDSGQEYYDIVGQSG